MGLTPTPPRSDQVEITLIGPGYGECVVVHLGGGHWVVIDSCIDTRTGQPAALSYLASIGVDPSAVGFIVATHWHDDHIRGMATLLKACARASFCASVALSRAEFVAMVSAYNKEKFSESSSGVREIHEVYNLLTGRPNKKAIADRAVHFVSGNDSGHGYECRVTTLSPSDAQVDIFFGDLAAQLPKVASRKGTRVLQGPNHIAVVTWIQVGPIALLLGSDLEHTASKELGWHAIVASSARPQGKACIYKVAHHGSKNAHFEGVWRDMLTEDVYAILTPYSRGSKLPTKGDAQRISQLTKNAFSSAPVVVRERKNPTGISAVDKTIRESDIQFREGGTGCIRIRNQGGAAFESWNVELDGACELTKVHL